MMLMRIGKLVVVLFWKINSLLLLDPYIYFLQQLKSELRQNFINKLLNHLKTYYEQKDIITTSEILEKKNWQYLYDTPSYFVFLCVIFFASKAEGKVWDFIFIFSHSPTQKVNNNNNNIIEQQMIIFLFATTNWTHKKIISFFWCLLSMLKRLSVGRTIVIR